MTLVESLIWNNFILRVVSFTKIVYRDPTTKCNIRKKASTHLKCCCSFKISKWVPMKYRSDYILTVMYLMDWTPSLILQNKVPSEVLFKNKPNYSHLRAFWCIAHALLLLITITNLIQRLRSESLCLYGVPFRD